MCLSWKIPHHLHCSTGQALTRSDQSCIRFPRWDDPLSPGTFLQLSCFLGLAAARSFLFSVSFWANFLILALYVIILSVPSSFCIFRIYYLIRLAALPRFLSISLGLTFWLLVHLSVCQSFHQSICICIFPPL